MTTKSEKWQWIGASGARYDYTVFPIQRFKTGTPVPGNYIFAARNPDGTWTPIYIGQGDLRDRLSNHHHEWDDITSKAATHIHAHRTPTEEDRLREEKDLLAAHPEAYEPLGCNERQGG